MSALLNLRIAALRTLGAPVLSQVPGPSSERWARRAVRGLRRSETPPPRAAHRMAVIQTLELGGRPVLRLSPRGERSRVDVVYVHGGGFVLPIQDSQWTLVERLLRATGARFFVPSYPLAPEHDHRDFDAAMGEILDRVMAGGRRTVLLADSAGASIALAEMIRRRDAGRPQVDAAVLLSPWVDLTLDPVPTPEEQRADPLLRLEQMQWAARWWAGPEPLDAPEVSPARGDLHGLPPLLVAQGGRDLVAPGALELVRRAQAAGTSVELIHEPAAPHMYMLHPLAPMGRRTVSRVAAHIRGR